MREICGDLLGPAGAAPVALPVGGGGGRKCGEGAGGSCVVGGVGLWGGRGRGDDWPRLWGGGGVVVGHGEEKWGGWCGGGGWAMRGGCVVGCTVGVGGVCGCVMLAWVVGLWRWGRGCVWWGGGGGVG